MVGVQELWARIRTGKYSEAYAAQIMRSILQVVRPLRCKLQGTDECNRPSALGMCWC